MKVLTVDRFNGQQIEALKKFVQNHRLAFHSTEWKENYPAGQLITAAILNDNNEITGCFLYFSFKRAFFEFLISPPFTPGIELFYLNPAASIVGKQTHDKEVMQLVADHFIDLNANLVELDLPPEITDTQPFSWKGFRVRPRYTYQADLTLSAEELLANLSSEKRKSLNKAAKDGVVVSESSDYEAVYQLVMRSLERNKAAANPGIIRNILTHYATKGNCISFMATQEGRPAAAAFCVTDRSRAIYLFGGFDETNHHHGAGVTCMWKCMLTAKERGLTVFDFEGSMNAGIERYFREFGGKLVPYYNIERSTALLNLTRKVLGK